MQLVVFLTAGGTVGKARSRADEGRGDYQERAAANSGDETEGGSSVCGGVVCFNSVSSLTPPPPPRLIQVIEQQQLGHVGQNTRMVKKVCKCFLSLTLCLLLITGEEAVYPSCAFYSSSCHYLLFHSFYQANLHSAAIGK